MMVRAAFSLTLAALIALAVHGAFTRVSSAVTHAVSFSVAAR